jgi:hypothetical protein
MKTKVLTSKDLNKSNGQIKDEIVNAENVTTIEQPENNELLKAFNELKEENEKLKASKSQVLDFEQAAELFRKKAKMLDEIGQLEAIKVKITNVNVMDNTQPDALDSYYYALGLTYSNRDSFMFKISNLSVIYEFVDFIYTKICAKIDQLKAEVQQL